MNGSDIGVRNAQLIEQYLGGNISLRELGRQHGISGERVRNVLAAAGVSSKRIRQARKKVQAQQQAERQCQQRYGVSIDLFHKVRDLDAALQREGVSLTILRCYERDKRRAARERIVWNLDLEQYEWIWQDFGQWDRGTVAKPQYQLGRLDESGPYDYSNSVLDTAPDKPHRVVQKRKYLGLPQGVRREGLKFVAIVRTEGRYKRFGPFTSVDDAAKAYQDGKSWSDGRGMRPSQMAYM